MTTPKLIETVARAMCIEAGIDPDRVPSLGGALIHNQKHPVAAVAIPHWMWNLELAKAAILATLQSLRNPSEAQVDAAYETIGPDVLEGYPPPETTWRSMIDFTIKEIEATP